MISRDIYYLLKPVMPRWLQIQIRRWYVMQQREKQKDRWPIDREAAKPPHPWIGWPGGKKFALVLTHDVDTEKGQKRSLELMRQEHNRGFRSSFNFVAEKYTNHHGIFEELRANGFEVGVHGIYHDENLFKSYDIFSARVPIINKYLSDWQARGFRAPCMYHNLEWTHELDIEYDASTFDTDPFEPQPDGVRTIFPFWVKGNDKRAGYVELPYTLPQDFTLFIIFQNKNIDIWKKKIDWIVEHGGMALLITHPDYMAFDGKKAELEEYQADYYFRFLEHVKSKYADQYWNPLPVEIARFWKKNVVNSNNDQ